MSNDVGWYDNEGRFYVIRGAKAGEFRPVETGVGPCVVKMRRKDDPPENMKEILEANAAAMERAAHRPTFYPAKGDNDAAIFCSCGWRSGISSFGFVTKKAAEKEANRRHSDHLRAEGRR
ncbi:hypothetical protein CFBP5507_06115 [Agrobacterium salinitolerans]|uniref:Uncharacterized protein n=1 Tax=Agrobacterium salinitolerans TaxID=1183413 RepID=A0A4Z1R666_9HYPH|nr:hypothetical protein [Agrobacterium salinitolerans]UYZ08574.1 hypothetical protein CFBP5507_06115 [Agrobacterium salinitolerans]